MTEINEIVFEEENEEATVTARSNKRLLLQVTIEKTETGRYKLHMKVLDAYDKYTQKIFVWNVNNNTVKVRDVVNVNNNYFYEYVDEEDYNQQAVDWYNEVFETYEEAYNKMLEILRKIKENREKVRSNVKEFHAYVLI